MSEPDLKTTRPQLQKQKSKDLHVNFIGLPEPTNEKEKYLTAKFDSKELSLIRKLLEIESWILEQEKKLCQEPDLSFEIDMDEILKLKKDEDKRNYLLEKLNKIKNKSEIDEFINCLIEKLKSC